MRAILQVGAVVLLLQGLAPLVQRGMGKDPNQSLFLVNAVPELQPGASVVLIVLGLACLALSLRRGARSRR